MDNKWSGFESQLVLTEVWACGVMVALKKGQSWYSTMVVAQLVEHLVGNCQKVLGSSPKHCTTKRGLP